MNAPETIYLRNEIDFDRSVYRQRYFDDHVYRLVDPNEKSKLERIRDEIERMRESYRRNARKSFNKDRNDSQMMCAGAASACTNSLEIIDRIQSE